MSQTAGALERATDQMSRFRAGRAALLYLDRNGLQAAAAAAFWSAFAVPWLLLALEAAALRLDRRVPGVSTGLESAIRDWLELAVPSPSVNEFLNQFLGVLRAEALGDFGLFAGFMLILSGTAITGGLVTGTARLRGRSVGNPLFGGTLAALKTYGLLVLLLGVSLPIALRGPDWLVSAGIPRGSAEAVVSAVAVLIFSAALACIVYRAACPDLRWRDLAPGVLLSTLASAVCLVALWIYLSWTFAEHSVLDAVAAPMGVLLACYAMATAILLGGAWIASGFPSAAEVEQPAPSASGDYP